MSSGIHMVCVDRDSPLLHQVESLFAEFYADLHSKALSLPLQANGAAQWRRSIERSLGKLNQVVVAVEDGRAVGFAQGVVRIGPSYLGSAKLGVVSHLYVQPDVQGRRVGASMVAELEDWFRTVNVEECELHAIWTNDQARDFWKKMGYAEKLVDMRKRL